MQKLLLIAILFAMPNTVCAGEYGMVNSLNELVEIREGIRSRLKDQLHMNPSAEVKEGALLLYCACGQNPSKFYYITGMTIYRERDRDVVKLASALVRLTRAKCGGCTDRPAAYFLHWSDAATYRMM